MELNVGQSYIRKNSPGSDIFKISGFDGDAVLFENGARIFKNTLINEFYEYQNGMEQAFTTEPIVNPDTFFNDAGNTAIMQGIQELAENPNKHASSNFYESKPVGSTLGGGNYEKITPGQNIKSTNPYEEAELKENINNNVQTTETIKLLPSRPKEYEVFDNVKLSEEIEINIPFKIKVPKASKIDVLNDMFNTSFTSYLSQKYIEDNLVKNPKNIQKLIQDSIEEWMNTELGLGIKKKKTVNKKKTVKHNNISNTNNKKEEVKNNVDIKYNIKDILNIVNAGQYEFVKKEYNSLKEQGIENALTSRLEGMLDNYEINI